MSPFGARELTSADAEACRSVVLQRALDDLRTQLVPQSVAALQGSLYDPDAPIALNKVGLHVGNPAQRAL